MSALRIPFAIVLTCWHYLAICARRLWFRLRYPPRGTLDARMGRVLGDLRSNGWAQLPGYLTVRDCQELVRQLDALLTSDLRGIRSEYAGAERRYFGVEKHCPPAASFHNDSFLKAVCEQYLGTTTVNVCTLANKSLPVASAEQVRDRWHRDSFGRQVKALVYLVDVDARNGPFEFLPGSNRFRRILSSIARGDLSALQWRISDEQIADLCDGARDTVKQFHAMAGTVLLIDTSAIHRASPISAGARYALTNYYVEAARYRKDITDALGVAFEPVGAEGPR